MSVIAIIADSAHPNGQQLIEQLAQLEGRATFLLANDLDSFKAWPSLGDVDIIMPVGFAAGKVPLLADLWPLCPKLRWVHSLAAGVETIVPVMNAVPGGPEMPLTNAKGAFSRSLAEYALGAMLHFNKQVPRLQANRQAKAWQQFRMAELHGQTVGFVGFGDIAQATARYCKTFGMRVLALRNSRSGVSGNELADAVLYGEEKLELFRQSDYVICSLPGGDATRHFCGEPEFACMKPTAVFLSMGRGTCVDEASLVAALRGGKIAGAALDVFEKEPLVPESPLWGCDNLLLSPHNADLTITYMQQAFTMFVEKFELFRSPDFSGFPSVVDKTKGY